MTSDAFNKGLGTGLCIGAACILSCFRRFCCC